MAGKIRIKQLGAFTDVAEKATPVSADTLLMNDSEDGGNPKFVEIGNLPSSGTGGAASEMWTFSTATSGDPTSGKCLLNNATQHSATYAHLSKTSDSGADFGAQLLALAVGDGFYVQQNSDYTRYHVFRVTGAPSDETTYVKIPVVCESYGADLANTEKVTFNFQYTGLQAHVFGGSYHTADTLANLNALISDDDVPGLAQLNTFTRKNVFDAGANEENAIEAIGGSDDDGDGHIGVKGTGGTSSGGGFGGLGGEFIGGAGTGAIAPGAGIDAYGGTAGAESSGGLGGAFHGTNGGASGGGGGGGITVEAGSAIYGDNDGGQGVDITAGSGYGSGHGGIGLQSLGGSGGATGHGGMGLIGGGGQGGSSSGAGAAGVQGTGGAAQGGDSDGGAGVVGFGAAKYGAGSDGAGVVGTGGGSAGIGVYGIGAASGYGVVGESQGVVAIDAVRISTGTNTALSASRVVQRTTNDAADGFGSLLEFAFTDSGVTNAILGKIGAVRESADTEGALVFLCGTDGAEEFMRLTHAGTLAITGKETISSTLSHATLGEVALDLVYTVNKATSGNDYGIRILKTDTASPGISYIIRALIAPSSEFYALTDDGKVAQTVSLNAATGDEYALSIAYTTNKLTSGDDYGLKIVQTDTTSPGASYLAWMGVGATAKAWVKNDGAAYFAGAVGINTTDPGTDKLRIQGNVAVRETQPWVRFLVTSRTQPFTFGGALSAELAGHFFGSSPTGAGIGIAGFSTGAALPAFRMQGHVGSTTPTVSPLVFEAFKSDGGTDRVAVGATEKAFTFYNGAYDSAGTSLITMLGSGNIGLGGVTSPTYLLSLSGQAARTIWMERCTTAATAGFNLTVQAGGATSGATDKNGGDACFSGGFATGSGSSNVHFQTATAGGAGTDDRSPTTKFTINGAGDLIAALTSGTTTIKTGDVAGVARAIHFDIPIVAGGAADAALDFQYRLDGTLEAGLLAKTTGGGTYQDAVWKIPHVSGDYGAAWASLVLPTPTSLTDGCEFIAYNSNASVLATRKYTRSNGAWKYVEYTSSVSLPTAYNAAVAADSYLELVHNRNQALPTISTKYLDSTTVKDVCDFPKGWRKTLAATVLTTDVMQDQWYYSNQGPRICELADGTIVIAWWGPTTSDIKFQRINGSTGAAIGSVVTVTGASQTAPAHFNLAAIPGTNNFVVVWAETTASHQGRFAIWDNSSSSTPVVAAADFSATTDYCDVCCLSTGKIIIVWEDASATPDEIRYAKYGSSGGAAEESATALASGAGVSTVSVCALTNDFWAVAFQYTGNDCGVFVFDSSTNPSTKKWPAVNPQIICENINGESSWLRIGALPNKGFFVMFHGEAENYDYITRFQWSSDTSWVEAETFWPFDDQQANSYGNTAHSNAAEGVSCTMFLLPGAKNGALFLCPRLYEGEEMVPISDREWKTVLPHLATMTINASVSMCHILSNRRLLVVYKDTADSNKAKILMFQEPHFKTSYVDANTVRIYNYTGKTQAMRASCVS